MNVRPEKDDNTVQKKPRAIKWVDETVTEGDKKVGGLVTNKSDADLIYKDPNNLNTVTTHKSEVKNLKSTIKPFKID